MTDLMSEFETCVEFGHTWDSMLFEEHYTCVRCGGTLPKVEEEDDG